MRSCAACWRAALFGSGCGKQEKYLTKLENVAYTIQARRVWLNLELIKKPPQCLEYVIVHELAHFFERNHTEQFVALLDRMLPHWRIVRDELNAEPLAHEDWST